MEQAWKECSSKEHYNLQQEEEEEMEERYIRRDAGEMQEEVLDISPTVGNLTRQINIVCSVTGTFEGSQCVTIYFTSNISFN